MWVDSVAVAPSALINSMQRHVQAKAPTHIGIGSATSARFSSARVVDQMRPSCERRLSIANRTRKGRHCSQDGLCPKRYGW